MLHLLCLWSIRNKSPASRMALELHRCTRAVVELGWGLLSCTVVSLGLELGCNLGCTYR